MPSASPHATPKSTTFAVYTPATDGSSQIMMLSGLMSRCCHPFACISLKTVVAALATNLNNSIRSQDASVMAFDRLNALEHSLVCNSSGPLFVLCNANRSSTLNNVVNFSRVSFFRNSPMISLACFSSNRLSRSLIFLVAIPWLAFPCTDPKAPFASTHSTEFQGVTRVYLKLPHLIKRFGIGACWEISTFRGWWGPQPWWQLRGFHYILYTETRVLCCTLV